MPRVSSLRCPCYARADCMNFSCTPVCLLAAAAIFSSCGQAKAEKFTFKPPSLSEEEQLRTFCQKHGLRWLSGRWIPAFSAFDKKTNGNKRRIDETAVYDVIEESCRQEKYADYGIKGIGNTNFLSGPGLAVAKTPGVIQGGGKNGERLARVCLDATEDKEMLTYGTFTYHYKNDKPRRAFSRELCIDLKLCTGNENAARYDMEDEVPDKTGPKRETENEKKKKKKKEEEKERKEDGTQR